MASGGVHTERNLNHIFTMEVNLSNMLFGGFMIEAIDFPNSYQCSERYSWKQNTYACVHTHTQL